MFDKTGTLTEGRPEVVVVSLPPGASLDESRVLALAASVERLSEHPMAEAVVAAAERRVWRFRPHRRFGARPGKGCWRSSRATASAWATRP